MGQLLNTLLQMMNVGFYVKTHQLIFKAMETLPKYVYIDDKDRAGRKNKKPFKGQFKYKNTNYYCGNFETIKEAQISVDIKRLSLGLEPLYLKRK